MLSLRWFSLLVMMGLGLVPAALAQVQFKVAGRPVQVHGFFSQGFAKSDTNNYMTMRTSEGSAALTDGGANISMRLTDKFRVGAQFYSRNIGELSNGRVEVDWAFGDYRFADWFGVRAGKVKTTLGLYNDTQDMEFLHTWALLPQSIYPADLRASTIAHVGADLYGDVSLRKYGTLSYTAHGGQRPDDPRGGYRYGLADSGLPLSGPVNGISWGADLRWSTPVPGLLAGMSLFDARLDAAGSMRGRFGAMPFSFSTKTDRTLQYYSDYQKGNLRVAGEYRRNYALQEMFSNGVHFMDSTYDFRAWYLSGAWRFGRLLEVGGYHSIYISDWPSDHSLPNNHLRDNVVTARFDITHFWNVKIEGHFMDGYGSTYAARGFYKSVNPQGLKPQTTMLLLRTGFNF